MTDPRQSEVVAAHGGARHPVGTGNPTRHSPLRARAAASGVRPCYPCPPEAQRLRRRRPRPPPSGRPAPPRLGPARARHAPRMAARATRAGPTLRSSSTAGRAGTPGSGSNRLPSSGSPPAPVGSSDRTRPALTPRTTSVPRNAGVFVRFPPLGAGPSHSISGFRTRPAPEGRVADPGPRRIVPSRSRRTCGVGRRGRGRDRRPRPAESPLRFPLG